MKKLLFVNLIALGISAVNLAPVYAGWKPSATEIPKDQEVENLQVSEVITNFISNYPNLDIYFKRAYGYAIFPTVTKGAIGIGAAYDKGVRPLYYVNQLCCNRKSKSVNFFPKLVPSFSRVRQ